MARHLSYGWSYDVPPYRAFQQRNRLDYLTAKGEQLEQRNFKVLELRERDGVFRCVTRMELEVPLPRWAKRFFKPRNTITQYELWTPPEPDGTRRYDILAEIASVPAQIKGFGVVTPRSMNGCHFQLELDVTARMPVFGSRLEALVALNLDKTVDGERDFGHQWLAGLSGSML